MAEDKTVWLLGAGFSRPLGGPLFADLISRRTERWVEAWARQRAHNVELMPKDCPQIYEKGVHVGLWKNAEECILLLDDARTNSITRDVVHKALTEQEVEPVPPALQVPEAINIEDTFTRFTQFVAIATSHYVPAEGPLAEAWWPFEAWTKTAHERRHRLELQLRSCRGAANRLPLRLRRREPTDQAARDCAYG